jgi:hypothetical protein
MSLLSFDLTQNAQRDSQLSSVSRSGTVTLRLMAINGLELLSSDNF